MIRFRDNYYAIKEELEALEKKQEDSAYNYMAYNAQKADDFMKYIRENVYFLLHISNAEPFDEFINLNKNKTRFVISDRIKANLIIDSKEIAKKDEVLHLFRDLSEVLFLKQDIWDLVKQGYCEATLPEDEKREKDKHYPDENRLKLLCCERYGSDKYDVSSTLGYQYEKELALLKQYRNILVVLSSDISKNSWNSYNAFNCLYKLDTIVNNKQDEKNALRFFGMLKNNHSKYLEEYLLKTCSEMKEAFAQACFIESQLGDEKLSLDYVDALKSIREEFNEEGQQNWLYNGTAEFETFRQIYFTYIEDKYHHQGALSWNR
ncbi:hypothetical protein [Paenibacillus hexagrammi]|uniref:Uncharacterized protein n=1 Tax=Paenibacillus hexagrammi TaxID=2908839 RepID=A0ABY3SIA2_9BACL|nr:hypothetical protein [Paenibacillus sp. YPD9-1]UJF33743.1 hypothetical protein L0M14_00285 [Paenibacillus sp. YPD9-1]